MNRCLAHVAQLTGVCALTALLCAGQVYAQPTPPPADPPKAGADATPPDGASPSPDKPPAPPDAAGGDTKPAGDGAGDGSGATGAGDGQAGARASDGQAGAGQPAGGQTGTGNAGPSQTGQTGSGGAGTGSGSGSSAPAVPPPPGAGPPVKAGSGDGTPTNPPTDPALDDVPIDIDDEEVIVIVGSRRAVRSKTDTLTAVDVVDVRQLESQGLSDMADMLRTTVPSFNINEQPISDAATLIRPINLRGLPPDMTVVLVNGKRRHRGAVIAFLGGGIADGAQGVDVSVIPSIALSQVEILRDGAAAQYGADAIAGVMNFALRRNREGVRFQAQYGSTYSGDGDALKISGNWGLPLTSKGFLNLSVEYSATDPTSRSIQRTDAAALRDGGNLAVGDPAQIWGAPRVSDNIKVFANAGIDVGENSETYLFGNYAQRSVLGGFYFRNPTSRGGVFSNDGGETILVGDLTPDDGQPCPTVPANDPVLLQQVIDDPNCFVFNEMFPGGFTPQFGGDISDYSLVGGVRGKTESGLRWDLSGGVGQSHASFIIQNTVNASMGPNTPTRFNPGAYTQTDQNLNLDLVYPAVKPLNINIAGGLEYREEKFTVTEGDRNSFTIGPLSDQGFSIGSNGFPGFSTDQAGTWRRRNVAAYLDLEGNVRKNWPVGVAVRAEQFDSFGSTLNGKLSSRIPLMKAKGAVDQLAFRGNVGTGFRAPTPGQANVTNVTTVFDGPSNRLINRGTIPPTNPIAVSKGGLELQPEKSINAAGGLVFRAMGNLTLTTDFYYIKLRDRISQSGTQQLTPDEAQALEDSGVAGASDLTEFRFYTNAFDTTTMGVDVVGTYEMAWKNNSRSVFNLAYNYNRTRIDDYDPDVIDDLRISELEDSLPRHRFVASAAQVFNKMRVLARLNYFSSFKDPDNTPDFRYAQRLFVDVEAGVKLNDTLNLVFGVQNVLNTFPQRSPIAEEVGNLYPENAPGGTNGGFWYTRIQARM